MLAALKLDKDIEIIALDEEGKKMFREQNLLKHLHQIKLKSAKFAPYVDRSAIFALKYNWRCKYG